MNPILSFEITKEGQIIEQIPDVGCESNLDGTLLNQLYPGIRTCRITLPAEKLESYEEAVLAGRISVLQHKGVDYRIVGASGSAKNGKFYCVDADHVDAVADRMARWPQSAIAYFGILVSPLKTMIEEPGVTVLVVPDLELGTNDCRGWVSERLFQKLRLPSGCFYQFRLAFEAKGKGMQAKGAFKVMQNQVADVLVADIIIPVSSIKPSMLEVPRKGLRLKSRVALGVREISRPLDFASSYTLVEHAPMESIEQEIVPLATAKISALKQAWQEGNHAALVEMIGAKCSFDQPAEEGEDEQLRAVEALLVADGSGELTRHPYVHQQLSKLLARWAFKTTTGGGFELPAFALADDGYLFAKDGKLYQGADWLPRELAITTVSSKYGLCVRYPIRMFEDLLPMKHLHPGEVGKTLCQIRGMDRETAEQIAQQQLCLAHTYTLHSQTAKENGGDFDFDYVCVVDSDRFPRFVNSRFNLQMKHVVTKDKQKKAKSGWFNMEFEAIKARGNKIGAITDLKTRCYAAGRPDLAYVLVGELQKEVDSLKHGVRADSKVLNEIRQQVPMCPWLALKNVERVSDMPGQIQVPSTDRVGHLYNGLRKQIEEMFETAMDISAFRGLMTGSNPTREMFDEVRFINSAYAAWQGILAQERKAAETTVAMAEKAVAAANGNAEAKRTAERKLNEARAGMNRQLEACKEQAGTIARIVFAWAQGKTSEREAWAEALHQTVSRGRGMGSILFHAFPQELVNATSRRTGGICRTVQTKKVTGHVAIEHDTFYQVNGAERRLLFRFDEEHRAFALN